MHVNDIVDRNFDKKVEAQKIDQSHLGKFQLDLELYIILCGLAFLVLINFNIFTISMALLSMHCIYLSFDERFTYAIIFRYYI